jgi:hypothetical protein
MTIISITGKYTANRFNRGGESDVALLSYITTTGILSK